MTTTINTKDKPERMPEAERERLCKRAMAMVAQWYDGLTKEAKEQYKVMPLSYVRQGTTYLIRMDANHAQWVEQTS